MQTIEITAKNLEEAKAQAAAKFGVDESQVEVTLIEESKGLFGKTQMKVKATVTGSTPTKEEKPAKAAAKGRAAKPKAEKVVEEVAAPVEVAAEEEKPAKPARPERKPKAAPKETAAPTEGSEVEADEASANQMFELLKKITDASGLDVTVTMSGFQGRYVNLSIGGTDAGYLVGKNGEVLNSLQYVLNVMQNQQVGNGIRSTIDGNDYRQHREEQLTTLANRIAEQVEKRGEEAVLDALPAFERRIIHKALSEHPGVVTYSEGEEPTRRVVIGPRE
ncbi:MAG: RNA-binding cell elongation regulator Jag/EloR [Fimbriimonadaceae bacterium]